MRHLVRDGELRSLHVFADHRQQRERHVRHQSPAQSSSTCSAPGSSPESNAIGT
jgi:hypothetical protein